MRAALAILALACVCLAAWPAQAQVVSVRSGEHESFSRLVFSFQPGRRWSIIRVKDGYLIDFDLEHLGLNDLGVFDLIPRTRITALIAHREASTVLIRTACDCPATGFLAGPGKLVVDVADDPVFAQIEAAEFVQADDSEPVSNGTPSPRDRLPELLPTASFFDFDPEAETTISPGSTFPLADATDPMADALEDDPTTVDENQNQAATVDAGGMDGQPSQAEMLPDQQDLGVLPAMTEGTAVQDAHMNAPMPGRSLLPIVTGRSTDQETAPVEPEVSHATDEEMAAEAADDLSQKRLEQTRNLVLKELARATAQGLLDPNTALQGTRDAKDAIAADEGARGSVVAPLRGLDLDEIESFLDALPNVRAESAFDRGIRTESHPRPLNAEGMHCIENEDVDIAKWTGEGTIYSQISQYRLALVEEFDRENRDAAIGLTRSYIYLSFGAEALAILNMIPLTGGDADIMRAMAEIVDMGYAENPGPFGDQISCNTAAAFWAAMAMPAFQRGMDADRKAILLAFSALPLHLRRHLGPTLALRFLEIGDRDTSFALRDAIDRAPGDHGEGYELLQANIDRDLGRTRRAERRFDTIAALDGALVPTALIERIELAIASGGDLPKGAVESVAALAFEYRGTPEGAQLAQAYVLANIVENQFDEALSSLLRIETGDESEADIFPELWSQLALGMAHTNDDVVFLSAYYKHRATLSTRQVSREARDILATRLVALGFGREAVTELGRHHRPARTQSQLLVARALIMSGEHTRARAVLDGVEGDEAKRLLAGIAEQGQSYIVASEIYLSLSDHENQVASAWRAGDWHKVARIADGTRRSAAELMTVQDPLELSQASAEAVPSNSEDSGIIASNQTRLTHSAWVRSTLKKLLED